MVGDSNRVDCRVSGKTPDSNGSVEACRSDQDHWDTMRNFMG